MCLRKVRYLQLLEEEESTFINSKEVAINECYEIIIDLFEALDQSISEQKFEMQTGVRRSKDQIKPNKTSGFYVTMFNCFHFDNKGVSVSEKVNLRKEILKLVMENEDTNLEKLLFIYLVN